MLVLSSTEMKLALCRTISNGYRIGFYLYGLELSSVLS